MTACILARKEAQEPNSKLLKLYTMAKVLGRQLIGVRTCWLNLTPDLRLLTASKVILLVRWVGLPLFSAVASYAATL